MKIERADVVAVLIFIRDDWTESLVDLFRMVQAPFVALLDAFPWPEPLPAGAPVGFRNSSGAQCWFNAYLHLAMSDRLILARAEGRDGGWAAVHDFFQHPGARVDHLVAPLARIAHAPEPPDVADVGDFLNLPRGLDTVRVRDMPDLLAIGKPAGDCLTEWISIDRVRDGGLIERIRWDVPLLWDGTHHLDGFAIHRGLRANNGHWIAYVKREGHWYECNDAYVRLITEKQAREWAGDASLLHFSRRPLDQVDLAPAAPVVADPVPHEREPARDSS